MPIFDTPITANDASLERLLAQPMPVLIYLYERMDESTQHILERAADQYAGDVLIVKINARENPTSYSRFEHPALPTIIGLQEGQIKSKGSGAADVEPHIKYLLGQGAKPGEGHPPTKDSTSSVPVHVQDASFQTEVLDSSIPVLVDFWAAWCGPCKMIAPTLDRLAAQYAGRVKIAKLNVDENQVSPGRYQVSGIPHLILFKNGKVVGKLVGAHPQQNIERLIQQAL